MKKPVSKSNGIPPAPTGLSQEARKLWQTLVDTFEFDAPALLILATAMQTYDRRNQAREILAKEGIVQVDRFQQSKPHPAVFVERDTTALLLKLMKSLNLDLEPLHDKPGRPAGR